MKLLTTEIKPIESFSEICENALISLPVIQRGVIKILFKVGTSEGLSLKTVKSISELSVSEIINEQNKALRTLYSKNVFDNL